MENLRFPSRTEMESTDQNIPTPEISNQEIIDAYDYLGNAASTTDCTGLIPSAPHTKAELESYRELYQFDAPYLSEEHEK